MLVFEALNAKFGDCLLLRWQDAGKDRLAVVDGGPAGVFGRLRDRLDELAVAGQTLRIDWMMVSHIDDDHINGLLQLMGEERTRADNHQPARYRMVRFWHNSFEELVGAVPANAGLSALAGDQSALSQIPANESKAVLASVTQGRKLGALIRRFNLDGNTPVGGLVLARQQPYQVQGLTVTVVGPATKELDALRVAWAKQATTPLAALADMTDKATANLSSIACLVERGGRRILLTGDARGDKVLEGLEACGRLAPAGVLELDVLKVPHHGSDRNVDQAFFERLPARHYVISADGVHGNPDQPTLRWIVQARGDAEYTIHFTNKVPGIPELMAQLKTPSRRFKTVFRADADKGLAIELPEDGD
ncbi:MAG: MBL fold metallo-hydrolase [Phenylobacterium sp.]